jgi:hypothetical protein
MARIAKSQDTANYRKGKAVQVGDVVRMKNSETYAYEFKAVASIARADNGREIGNGRDYLFTDSSGVWQVQAAGGMFVQGQY